MGGLVGLTKARKTQLDRHNFSTSIYHYSGASTWLPLPSTMRSLKFRPDGTVSMDRYTAGEGRWQIEGNEVLVTFEKLNGKPAAQFREEWPSTVEKLIAEEQKDRVKHKIPKITPSGVAAMKASAFPYAEPWRFQTEHRWITSDGPGFVLKQTSGDPLLEAEYMDPDFR